MQAEVCLLLSHWGPYSFETEINHHWADLALIKASQKCTCSNISGRERLRQLLLRKCCENRRRLLAFYNSLPAEASRTSQELGSGSDELAAVAASINLSSNYGSKERGGVAKAFERNCELAEIMSMFCALRDQHGSINPVEQTDIMNAIRRWDERVVEETQALPNGSKTALVYQTILFLRQQVPLLALTCVVSPWLTRTPVHWLSSS
jgi:hypothetical protein